VGKIRNDFRYNTFKKINYFRNFIERNVLKERRREIEVVKRMRKEER
jgi:hypothetical protein